MLEGKGFAQEKGKQGKGNLKKGRKRVTMTRQLAEHLQKYYIFK